MFCYNVDFIFCHISNDSINRSRIRRIFDNYLPRHPVGSGATNLKNSLPRVLVINII